MKQNKYQVIIVAGVFGFVILAGILFNGIFSANPKEDEGTQFDKANQRRLAEIEETLAELLRLQHDSASSAKSDLLQRIAELQRQIDALKDGSALRDLPELGAQLDVNSEFPLSHDEMMAEEKIRAEERQALIEEAFLVEETDNSWSSDMTARIDDAFRLPELSGGRLTQVDCRSTLCLVEFEVPPSNELSSESLSPVMFENEVIAALSQDLPTGTIKSTPLGDGNLHYTIYFARKGTTLPQSE